MVLDISWLNFYMPIFGFLFVFVVMFAILLKTKVLGDNVFTNSFISFIFAVIFITFAPGVDFITMVLPWFVILIVSLLLVLIIVGFSQENMETFMKPWLGWAVIVLLMVIFLVSAIVVFNPVIGPYLPGAESGEGALFTLKDFVYGEQFLGGLLILVVAVAASWLIAKKAGGD
ncbi:MAG: hypothetical protein U9Q06_00205 [Nanoarchaeota archaeon]|nr:hypothetical protein [Nanoarchaeota archaeon]